MQTPLRISLLGGGSDFPDYYKNNYGAVLTTAIDKSVYVVVKKRFDKKIYINWSKKEIVDKADDIEHELVRCAMILTGVDGGIEITMLSDVPSEGTGLGSSSSITVALLHAFYTYRGVLVTAEQLANEACHIEIEMLGKPIGCQDQYICAYGGLRFISFDKSGVFVESVTCNKQRELNENLMLFHTGVSREAKNILSEQKNKIENNISILKQMADLAVQGKHYLFEGDIDDIGKLLDDNWNLKKKLASKIDSQEIEDIYNLAKKAGAIGGKVIGAGGGGFVLLYVKNVDKENIRKALKAYRELPFKFSPMGSRVIFMQGE